MNVGHRRGGVGGGGWVRFGRPTYQKQSSLQFDAWTGNLRSRQVQAERPTFAKCNVDRADQGEPQGEKRTTNQQTKLLPPRPDGAHTVYCIWNITELWRYAAVLENWQLCSRVSTLPFCQLFEMNCFCFPLSVPPCSPFLVASLRQNTQKITLSEKWN